MTYKAHIEGMHCPGCENLIKLSLEEIGFTEVNVSLSNKTAVFNSERSLNDTKEALETIFSSLIKYKISSVELN